MQGAIRTFQANLPIWERVLPTQPIVGGQLVRPGSSRSMCCTRTMVAMKRNVLAALLWSYTGWYAGAMATDVFGTPSWLGLLLAFAGLSIAFALHGRAVSTESTPGPISRS
jgi:hypothetical protein